MLSQEQRLQENMRRVVVCWNCVCYLKIYSWQYIKDEVLRNIALFLCSFFPSILVNLMRKLLGGLTHGVWRFPGQSPDPPEPDFSPHLQRGRPCEGILENRSETQGPLSVDLSSSLLPKYPGCFPNLQILDLPSLHNDMIQFDKINLSLLFICIYNSVFYMYTHTHTHTHTHKMFCRSL